MAQGNQIGGALGGHDAGEACGFHRITFRSLMLADRGHSFGRHNHARGSDRATRGCRLLAGVNHFRAAVFVDMRKVTHGIGFSDKTLTAEGAEDSAEDAESSYLLTTRRMPLRKWRT